MIKHPNDYLKSNKYLERNAYVVQIANHPSVASHAEVAEWEVAVMHRAHHARPGTCLRSTWGTTDPAHIDDAIEAFKFESLAKIEDLPGFCSASLLVNRAEGRAVVTVAYDSREALERSRERSEGVRAEAARASDLAVHDVAEFDLEVGHLHIPEKV